jgi:hypothetical protein
VVRVFELPAGQSGEPPVRIYRNTFVARDGAALVILGASSGSGLRFLNNVYWPSRSPFVLVWNDARYSSLAAWRSGTGQERWHGLDTGLEVDSRLEAPAPPAGAAAAAGAPVTRPAAPPVARPDAQRATADGHGRASAQPTLSASFHHRPMRAVVPPST